MQLAKIFSVLALTAASVSAARLQIRGDAETAIPNTFMLEVNKDVTDTKAYITEELAKAGVAAEDIVFRTEIDTEFFKGASFSLPDFDTDEVVSSVNALQAFRVAMVDAPQPIIPDASSTLPLVASEAFHALTGVNEARNRLGVTGKGIRVAVIDSGVDYMNPCSWWWVSYGFDLVGDRYGARNGYVATPDSDPLDNCSAVSHGTHVAGTIAGNTFGIPFDSPFAPPVNFTGVAPEAEIGAYRVFGCASDGVSNDIITAAIFRAAADGSHVINLSLGGGPAQSDSPDAYAAEVVSKRGAIVVASNGNSQVAGLMTNASPAVSRGALGVASFDNAVVNKPFLTVDDASFPYSLGSENTKFTYNTPSRLLQMTSPPTIVMPKTMVPPPPPPSTPPAKPSSSVGVELVEVPPFVATMPSRLEPPPVFSTAIPTISSTLLALLLSPPSLPPTPPERPSSQPSRPENPPVSSSPPMKVTLLSPPLGV
ncbi:peptidase S8/S53 domain-containing protein [Chytridium lagenaria]|nr:peptidase S8/S53 domain-containing protein [Chytridium lagenaria]